MADPGLITFLICIVYLQVSSAQNLDCDFESDFCEWTFGLDSDRNWTRSHVKSASPNTGPSTGHSLDTTNYYIYLHARDFRDDNNLVQPGQKCVLMAPEINTHPEGGCFRFWYHMTGSGIGNLSISAVLGASSSLKFHKSGEQGADWICGTVSLDGDVINIQLEIEATTGANVRGDIALDDFKYYNQQCQQLPAVCGDEVSTPSSTLSDSTTVSTETSTDTSVTTLQPSKTTETAPDDSWIIYVAIVPIGILIIGAIIAFCIFKMRKKPHKDMLYDVTEGRRTVVEDEPEEYAELDEMGMDEGEGGNDGYTLPTRNGRLPSNNNHMHSQRDSIGGRDYLQMKTSLNEAHVKDDDDSSSYHSYIDALPGPIMDTNTHVDSDTKTGVSNAGFSTDELNPGLRTEIADAAISSSGLHNHSEGVGREPPAPDCDDDYDTQPPPPKCGPNNGYIRPVFDG